MLTPRFELEQDAEFVLLRVHAPHVRPDEGELVIEGHTVRIYLKPYFLRLTFHQRLTEDGREHASYDATEGVLSVRLPKETRGEAFTGLGMLSELLRKPAPPKAAPRIEVIGSSDTGDGAEGGPDGEGDEEEDDEWADPNELLAFEAEAEQAFPSLLQPAARYGFNDAFSGLFTGLEGEELLQLANPEGASKCERRQQRLRAEAQAFDEDHYMADFMEGQTEGSAARAALAFVPWWREQAAHAMREHEGIANGGGASVAAPAVEATAFADGSPVGWSDEEKDQLLQLPRKEMLLSRVEASRALCGLADVLYGYCYDVRTTEGEHTCESGWTVRVLSSQLSWLDAPVSPAEAAATSVRRALCFPLVRHWGLAHAVLADVSAMLRLGKRAVLRALLSIHRLMLAAEYGYLLNRCLVDEFAVWVQQTPERRLLRLADALGAAAPAKEAIGWPLAQYEALAMEEEEGESEGEGEDESSSSGEVSGGEEGEGGAAAPPAQRQPLIEELGETRHEETCGMELEGKGTLV